MPRHFRAGIARKCCVEKEGRRGNDCDAEEGRPEIGSDDRMVTAFLTGSSSIIMAIMITTTTTSMISTFIMMPLMGE